MTIIIVFCIGAIFGSFFGLVIDRLPAGESIVFGSSRCQNCGKNLIPLDLIPILSQLLSKSRCRYCGRPIPYWYAGLELLCALLFLAAWSNLMDLSTALFLLMGLILSIFDWKYHEFPFIIWLIFTLIIFIISPFEPLALIWLFPAILSERWNLRIGSGDLLWLCSASLTLDFLSLVWLVQIASLTGITQFLLTKEKDEIAFIPHLTAASLILWAAGQIL
ncbi:prepilin peptidase [Lactovum odontotermitis]